MLPASSASKRSREAIRTTHKKALDKLIEFASDRIKEASGQGLTMCTLTVEELAEYPQPVRMYVTAVLEEAGYKPLAEMLPETLDSLDDEDADLADANEGYDSDRFIDAMYKGAMVICWKLTLPKQQITY